MSEFRNKIEERVRFLETVRKDTEKRLKNAPKGTLRICAGHNRIQFYHRQSPSDRIGKYLKKKEKSLAVSLAQKDYDQRLLKAIDTEIAALNLYLAKVSPAAPEDLQYQLSEQRRLLITPAFETDEMYIRKWSSEPFTGKEMTGEAPDYETDKGEIVRSKSELIIANTLAKLGIPYKYECPLFLRGFGIIYPDFTVLQVRKRKEIYWEHLGMMDDPDYARKAVKKIQLYNTNKLFQGDRLLITSETSQTPINIKQIKAIINHVFEVN